MKTAIVVILLVVVLYMASSAPAPVAAQSLPSGSGLPVVGVPDVLSPVQINGSANINSSNQVVLAASGAQTSQAPPTSLLALRTASANSFIQKSGLYLPPSWKGAPPRR